MKTWVDYYNKKAQENVNFLEVSDMHIGDDLANDQFLNNEKKRLINLLQPKPEYTLVDLGCCAGVCLGLIKNYYKKVIGVDLAEDALNVAKKRLSDCDFILDDIASPTHIPFHIADHLLTYGVLQFLSNEQLVGYIKTIDNTLKPGGKAVIIRTPNKEHYNNYQEYRNKRNTTRPVLTDQNLQWNWISPEFIKEICSDRFEVIIILPTTGTVYPLKGFFDFVLIKKV